MRLLVRSVYPQTGFRIIPVDKDRQNQNLDLFIERIQKGFRFI